MTENIEMLNRILRGYWFDPLEKNENVRYTKQHFPRHRTQEWRVTTWENEDVVVEVCEALGKHEATVLLSELTYPYFMMLSVSDLRNLHLFDVRLVEMNYERVSFIIDKNSFVMIDLKEVCEQYSIKRKIVILM